MSDVDRANKYDLHPEVLLPSILANGFYIPRTIEVLHLYGGFINPPPKSITFTTESLKQDFLITYPKHETIVNEFFDNFYTTFEAFLEILVFIVNIVDVVFQASHQSSAYLSSRDDSRRELYKALCGLFGFNLDKRKDFDKILVDRSHQYAPDLELATIHFSKVIDGHVKADSSIFSLITYGYTNIAFIEVFKSMLFYRQISTGSYITTCPICRETIQYFRTKSLKSINCSKCSSIIKIDTIFELET